MRAHSNVWLSILVLAVMVGPGCDDDDGGPMDPGQQPPVVPAPTTPEALVDALQVIYNDKLRTAPERLAEYTNLFPPADHPTLTGFIFRLQPDDATQIGQESWGLDQELNVHDGMFGAQDERDIFSLALTIQHQPAESIEFPDPGQEDWMRVFATNVNVRLLFAPDDGLEVNGGQAEFLMAPADNRWYIAEWTDLPRP